MKISELYVPDHWSETDGGGRSSHDHTRVTGAHLSEFKNSFTSHSV